MCWCFSKILSMKDKILKKCNSDKMKDKLIKIKDNELKSFSLFFFFFAQEYVKQSVRLEFKSPYDKWENSLRIANKFMDIQTF